MQYQNHCKAIDSSIYFKQPASPLLYLQISYVLVHISGIEVFRFDVLNLSAILSVHALFLSRLNKLQYIMLYRVTQKK